MTTTMRICVYGSSSKQTPKAYLDSSHELGVAIGQRGHVCVNGGGRFGVMGAASAGCRSVGGKVVGIIHESFCVDQEEDHLTEDIIISRGCDLTERKQLLMNNGDCIIVMPGGVGTFEELWETASAKSLGMKGLTNKPVCVVNVDGFYDGFIAQLKRAKQDTMLYKDHYFGVANSSIEALDWCLEELKSIKALAVNKNDDNVDATRTTVKPTTKPKDEKGAQSNSDTCASCTPSSCSMCASGPIVVAFAIGAVVGMVLSRAAR